MEKKTLKIYWEFDGNEFEGFADFDGDRIRYCKGTSYDEGKTIEMLESEDCMPGFPIEEVWEELVSLCDEDGRLDIDRNPLG